jgi:hypothetical protein
VGEIVGACPLYPGSGIRADIAGMGNGVLEQPAALAE